MFWDGNTQWGPGAEPRWESGGPESQRMLHHEAEKTTNGERKAIPYRLTLYDINFDS